MTVLPQEPIFQNGRREEQSQRGNETVARRQRNGRSQATQ